MISDDYDDRLRLLRRELSLASGRRAKPTIITAAHAPMWKRFFEPSKVKEIRKSAARVENLLNEMKAKPKSPEDFDLFKKDRSLEDIRLEIKEIPIISATCLPSEPLPIDTFLMHQIWLCRPDRHIGREQTCFVISCASVSSDMFRDGLNSSITLSYPASGQAENLSVHDDDRDRSSRTKVKNRAGLILSKATHALLRSDVRFCADPRNSNYNVFLGYPMQQAENEGALSLSLAVVRKADGTVQGFKIIEDRLPEVASTNFGSP